MPELPEVETIRRDLLTVRRKTVKSAEVLDMPRLVPGRAFFMRRIKGLKLKDIERVGKLLVFDFDKWQMLVHLKMTGQLVLRTKKEIISGGHPMKGMTELPNKFTRVIFNFSGGEILYFNDMRKFGYIKLVTPEEAVKLKKPYGVDPLSVVFTEKFWNEVVEKSSRSIVKHFLLRQTPVSGLGNIYVDEACFRARILPTRSLGSLNKKERRDLYRAIKEVLRLSIKNRGTSFNTYMGADGKKGSNYEFLGVYGRKGKPCKRCKTPIKKTRVAGRGTHFCPRCQK